MSLIVTNNAQFLLSDGENLLDALEHTGHEVEYQCREGYCGSCRTKIRQGKENIQYKDFPLAFVARDEILPCCCTVTGQIEIDCTQEKVPAEMQPELFTPAESKHLDALNKKRETTALPHADQKHTPENKPTYTELSSEYKQQSLITLTNMTAVSEVDTGKKCDKRKPAMV